MQPCNSSEAAQYYPIIKLKEKIIINLGCCISSRAFKPAPHSPAFPLVPARVISIFLTYRVKCSSDARWSHLITFGSHHQLL